MRWFLLHVYENIIEILFVSVYQLHLGLFKKFAYKKKHVEFPTIHVAGARTSIHLYPRPRCFILFETFASLNLPSLHFEVALERRAGAFSAALRFCISLREGEQREKCVFACAPSAPMHQLSVSISGAAPVLILTFVCAGKRSAQVHFAIVWLPATALHRDLFQSSSQATPAASALSRFANTHPQQIKAQR